MVLDFKENVKKQCRKTEKGLVIFWIFGYLYWKFILSFLSVCFIDVLFLIDADNMDKEATEDYDAIIDLLNCENFP